MKTWEKHQVDLYLLANDILENLYYQQHGYKSSFYYDFNYKLKFLQSDGTRSAQLKLLSQLVDMCALEYAIKLPSKSATNDFVSKNIKGAWAHKKLIHLHINPLVFNVVYTKLKQYAPAGEQPLLQSYRRVYLRTDATRVIMVPPYDKCEYEVGTFRAGGSPAEIITYIINFMPNTLVHREALADSGHRYSRKLNEMASDVFNELAYHVFVRGPKANSLTILNPVDIEIGTLETLIAETEN